MNIQVLYHFNDSIKLYDLLNKKIQDNFVVRPYSEMGWETKKRYEEILGKEKVVPGHNESFYLFIRKSKLVICSYPQTTFTEAMVSGKPCILFYNPIYNETVKEANELINLMIEANIIFTCPYKAAEHINKIWDNIEEWWMSKEVNYARQKFYLMALNSDKSFLHSWYRFLKSS
jgi:putative transferase (TIGR04331 family)